MWVIQICFWTSCFLKCFSKRSWRCLHHFSILFVIDEPYITGSTGSLRSLTLLLRYICIVTIFPVSTADLNRINIWSVLTSWRKFKYFLPIIIGFEFEQQMHKHKIFLEFMSGHPYTPSGKVQFLHPHCFSWPSRDTKLSRPSQEKCLFSPFLKMDGKILTLQSFCFVTSCVQDFLVIVLHPTFSIAVSFPCFLLVLWSLHFPKNYIFCNFVLTSARNLSQLKLFKFVYLKGLVTHFRKMVLFIMLWLTVSEILGFDVS